MNVEWIMSGSCRHTTRRPRARCLFASYHGSCWMHRYRSIIYSIRALRTQQTYRGGHDIGRELHECPGKVLCFGVDDAGLPSFLRRER